MKLEQKLPDRAGEWWCWRKEFTRPSIRYIGHGGFYTSSPLTIPDGITHFAGPIELPEMPEPDRIEAAARIVQDSNCVTHRVVLDAMPIVPRSFVGVELKVTLEKV